jgi:hypothetical protein
MTNDYIELINVDHALTYIQTALRQAGAMGALSAENLKVVDGVQAFSPFKSVSQVSLAATEASLHQSLKSSIQHGLPQGTNKSGALVSEIEGHLSLGASQIVIFLDTLGSVDDAWVAEPDEASPPRVAQYGNEIFYLLLAKDIGSNRIATTIHAGTFNDYFVGLFSELLGADRASPIMLSSDELITIVKGARSIVVGAFDGESFLKFRVTAKGERG